jgi:hypothetical protein
MAVWITASVFDTSTAANRAYTLIRNVSFTLPCDQNSLSRHRCAPPYLQHLPLHNSNSVPHHATSHFL